MDNRYLIHYGIKQRSGRYPYGSGDRPYQHSMNKLRAKREVKRQLKDSRKDIGHLSEKEMQTRLKRKKLENQYVKTQNDGLLTKKRAIDDTENLIKGVRDINNKKNRNSNNRPMDLSKMSNKELSSAINRWTLEQNYTRMYNQRNISRGQYYVDRTLDYAGDIATIAGSALSLYITFRLLKMKGI